MYVEVVFISELFHSKGPVSDQYKAYFVIYKTSENR